MSILNKIKNGMNNIGLINIVIKSNNTNTITESAPKKEATLAKEDKKPQGTNKKRTLTLIIVLTLIYMLTVSVICLYVAPNSTNIVINFWYKVFLELLALINNTL